MQQHRSEASKNLALDVMLRTFMNSTEFQNLKFKNWDSVAKLVPGITARQCLHRWEELRSFGANVTGDYSGLTAQGRPLSSSQTTSQFQRDQNFHYTPRPPRGEPPVSSSNMETRGLRASTSAVLTNELQSYQSKMHRSKSDIGFRLQPSSFLLSTHKESHISMDSKSSRKDLEQLPCTIVRSPESAGTDTSSSGIPNIVVHVYDEAKKAKKDFTCPRDLIVEEMRYFADYLSTDVHIYDDVDISVHCDIGIFDWLMQYAKRGLLEDTTGNVISEPLKKPSLKPGNVISILISSNFLKMPTLVEDCLVYCHDHMAEIVQLPCNMSCLSDELLTRLADKFTAIECEDLLDKKDRIRNKLFSKKLQQLFEPTFSTSFSPSNASTLFRCQHCHTLLTADQSTKLPCIPGRLVVDWRGRISFTHERDLSWNCNNYLISLKEEGLNWRSIFWKLWGIVNDLHCSECGQFFQCGALTSCPYHPQPATASAAGSTYYLCCQQPYNTFSTLAISQSGCQLKDHSVLGMDKESSPLHSQSEHHFSKTFSDSVSIRQKSAPPTSRGGSSIKQNQIRTVYNVLNAYRDAICVGGLQTDYTSKVYSGNSDVSIFKQECERVVCPRSRPSTTNTVNSDTNCLSRETSQSSVRNAHRSQRSRNSRMRHYQQESISDVEEDELDIRSISSQDEECTSWKWDTSKTKLWNEDTQRKHDEKMMKAVLSTRLATASQQHKKVAAKRKEAFPGGIYAKLETQFKTAVAAKSLNSVTMGGNRTLRDKRGRIT